MSNEINTHPDGYVTLEEVINPITRIVPETPVKPITVSVKYSNDGKGRPQSYEAEIIVHFTDGFNCREIVSSLGNGGYIDNASTNTEYGVPLTRFRIFGGNDDEIRYNVLRLWINFLCPLFNRQPKDFIIEEITD